MSKLLIVGVTFLCSSLASAQQPPAPQSPPPPATTESAPAAKAPVARLAKSFKGSYRFISTVDFREYGQTTEIEIASQDDAGNITGFFSTGAQRWGTSPEVICFAANRLPMSGSYDGEKITFTVKASQNGPGCKDYVRMFLRGKDHYFERRAPDDKWYYYYDPVE